MGIRVEHVITRLIVGGAQENTLSTVLYLRKIPQLEVTLTAGSSEGPEGSLESLARAQKGLFHLEPRLVRPVSPLSDLSCLLSLTRRFQRLKPQIVHTHSGKAGLIGRMAAAFAGVPVVFHTIHGPSFGAFQGAGANLIYTNAERLAGRFTDHFVVVANAMRDQYLAAGIGKPEEYTRVFYGFSLEPYLRAGNDLKLRAKYGLEPDDVVIGKMARLFHLKGHDVLFQIAPRIIQAEPRVKFLLVGDGILREQFERILREKGILDHFVFTGLVPPSDVPSLTGIMDILIHLSEREGLPRALAQALAAARPVISFDRDGAREICLNEETGLLIAPNDLAALERGLLRLIRDPDLRYKLGKRGRAYVQEHFPERKMGNEIYNLYRQFFPEQLPPH